MKFEYFPDEIAVAIVKATGETDAEIYSNCVCALYELKAICENGYNAEYYRDFYKQLERLVDALDSVD